MSMNIRKSLFGKHDLTNGCIWKTILVFCLPIFLSYLLQHFYSIADNAICGRTLSSSEIAGVGDTGSISFIFLQFAFGCTAGMSTVMSNKIGENDIDGARKAFATQIVLSVVKTYRRSSFRKQRRQRSLYRGKDVHNGNMRRYGGAVFL